MHNPRKKVRININHLDHEISALNKKMRKFVEEKNRLRLIADYGSEKECESAAANWNHENWFAFEP